MFSLISHQPQGATGAGSGGCTMVWCAFEVCLPCLFCPHTSAWAFILDYFHPFRSVCLLETHRWVLEIRFRVLHTLDNCSNPQARNFPLKPGGISPLLTACAPAEIAAVRVAHRATFSEHLLDARGCSEHLAGTNSFIFHSKSIRGYYCCAFLIIFYVRHSYLQR